MCSDNTRSMAPDVVCSVNFAYFANLRPRAGLTFAVTVTDLVAALAIRGFLLKGIQGIPKLSAYQALRRYSPQCAGVRGGSKRAFSKTLSAAAGRAIGLQWDVRSHRRSRLHSGADRPAHPPACSLA